MVKCCFEDLTLPDVLGSDTLDARHCYRLAGGLSILVLMPGSGPCSVPSPEWTADCMYVYCMYMRRHWSGLQTAGSVRSGPQTRGPTTRHSWPAGPLQVSWPCPACEVSLGLRPRVALSASARCADCARLCKAVRGRHRLAVRCCARQTLAVQVATGTSRVA